MSLHKLINNQALEIVEDAYPRSPDEWGNEDIFLVYEHRQFTVEREGFKPEEIYNIAPEGYHVFVVYAYIHGGVSLSLGGGACSWDTSSTGYILVKKDEGIKDEKASAQCLIEEWNQYLGGSVYGFKLYDLEPYKKVYENKAIDIESGEDMIEVDACWGYYADSEEDALKTILEDQGHKLKEEKHENI